MAYVRISFMRPQRGQEGRVHELLKELIGYYEQQPGYMSGYLLEHRDGSNRYGRIGIWASEEDAEHAAQREHDLALRAELNRAIIPESHEELSFEGTPSALRAQSPGAA
jgi:heme-degrading monooxygenase HmoA